MKQLARWHEDDEFQKIVDAILALPEEERDYDLTGQLARALNNLEDYETAAEVLLTVEAGRAARSLVALPSGVCILL